MTGTKDTEHKTEWLIKTMWRIICPKKKNPLDYFFLHENSRSSVKSVIPNNFWHNPTG